VLGGIDLVLDDAGNHGAGLMQQCGLTD
jgi:hypothetical protein